MAAPTAPGSKALPDPSLDLGVTEPVPRRPLGDNESLAWERPPAGAESTGGGLVGTLRPGLDASRLPTPEQHDTAQTLDLTQGFSTKRSPDASAQALELSRETGISFEEAEQKVKEGEGLTGVLRAKPSWGKLVQDAPVLAERLTDPGLASAMQDDVDNLSGLERWFSNGKSGQWENLKRAGNRGLLTSRLADIGFKELYLTATPADIAEADRIEKEMEQYPEEKLGYITGIPSAALESAPIMGKTLLRSVPYAGAGALAGAGVGAAAGAPVGGVGAGPGALAGARFGLKFGWEVGNSVESGKVEAGLAYRELKKIPGVDPNTARNAAWVVGVVNGMLETVGMESILKAAGGKKLAAKLGRDQLKKALENATTRKVVGELVKKIAEAGISEGVTEYLQELSNIVAEGEVKVPDAGFGDRIGIAWKSIKENQPRALEAGLKGAQGGIGMAGAGGLISLRGDLKAVQRAKDRVSFFEELGKRAKDSTTRQRLPEEFRNYVDKLEEKYGTIGTVNVPADKLISLFQKNEIDIEDIRKKMPNVARALDEAVKVGAGEEVQSAEEVPVILSDFATYIAPLEGFEGIKEDLRVGDEPTLREAKGVEEQAKKILGMADKLEAGSLLPESSKTIFNDVAKRLTDVGISEETAQRYAALWTAFSESRAKRLGVDPAEYYKGLGLTITNADLVEALSPSDAIETLTPEQLKLREEARAGNEKAFDALIEHLQTDALTGANTNSAWKIFKNKNRPGWYVSLDVNDLKKINDLVSHSGGDEYLKTITDVIGPETRNRKGKFFRGGQGDEFISHFVERKQAEDFLAAVTPKLNALGPMFGDVAHVPSVSLGLAQTFEQADAALLKAKERARAAGRSGTMRPEGVKTPDYTHGNVFSHVDESAPVQSLKQKIEGAAVKPERDALGFFSGAEKIVLDAKQVKGDAKSWMSILSKSAKKEELEFLGIEEWLGKLGRAATKDEVAEFIRAHRVSIEEAKLGEVSEEQSAQYEQILNDYDVNVRRRPDGSYRFSYTTMSESETTDFDEGFRHAKDSGQVSGRTAAVLSDGYEEIQGILGDLDNSENFDDRTNKIGRAQELAQEWTDRADGTGMEIKVSDDGDLSFTGFTESESTLTDPEEIVQSLKETHGYREAEAAEEAFGILTGSGSSNTQYENYTLGRGAYAKEGTYREILFYAPGEQSKRPPLRWDAPHFDDQGKGLLAHARVSIHEIGGKNVLFIDEIQSDRFQHARDAMMAQKAELAGLEQKLAGYEKAPPIAGTMEEARFNETKAEIERVKAIIAKGGFDSPADIENRVRIDYNEGAQRAEITDPLTGRKTSARPNTSVNPESTLQPKAVLAKRAAKMFAEDMFNADEAVLDAPLKTVWEEFVAKRLLMYAAEQGVDHIAWTTGAQQADRYSLAHEVSKISWRKNEDGTYAISVYDKQGDRFRHDAIEGNKTPAELRGVIGAGLTQKIVESTEQSDTIQGDGLKVGGEGMKFAYDKKIPSIFEKLLKKEGGKVEQVEHTGMRRTVSKVHFTMPPAQIDEMHGRDIQSRIEKLQSYVALAEEMRQTGKSIEDFGKEIDAYKEGIAKIPRYKEIIAENVKDPSHLTEQDRAWAKEQWWIEPSMLEGVGTLDDKFWDMQKEADEKAIDRFQRDMDLAREMAKEPLLRHGYQEDESIRPGRAVPNSVDVELLTDAHHALSRFQVKLFEAYDPNVPEAQRLSDEQAIKEMFPNQRAPVSINDINTLSRQTGFDLSKFVTSSNTVEPGDKVWSVNIPEATLKRISDEGLSLFQKGTAGTTEDYRGKIEFDDTRRWFRVTLTGSANLSTFLHESGHAFLEILRRDAATDEKSAADLKTLEKWMADGSSTREEALEKFARGFETYLMEGKAPSFALVDTFRAVKAWLKMIYSTFTKLRAPLTDDVRQVMDRLLATDEEINTARSDTGLFPVEIPGLDPAEAKAFRERYERAVEAKKEEMERDSIAAARRAVTNAQREIRTQVETEARGRKDYNAAEYLRTGKFLDKTLTPAEEIAGKKLSKKTIGEYVEEGDRRRVKLLSMIDDNGLDADAMAPFLGYKDGQELVSALLDAPSRAKWVADEVESRMKDKYPDADIASLAEQAVKKLHEPEIDKMLEAELDAFDRKTGANPNPRARDVLRTAAKQRVTEMTSQEMQPGTYLRNEERAAKDVLAAVAKKDFTAAREARQRQMWNRFMYREVTAAKEEIANRVEHLRSFEDLPKRKRIGRAGENYINSIDAIVDGIELTKQTDKALDRRKSLATYLDEMEANGEPVAIPPEVRAELGLKNYRQMTLSEIRAVDDAVTNIETMASLKNKLIIGKNRRDLVKTTTKLAEHVRANVGSNYKDGIGEPSWWAKKKDFLRKARANMAKIEFVCRVLDGGKTAGWAHELLFQPFRDAQAKKWAMTKEITEELIRPFKEMSMKDRIRYDRKVDFLGQKIKVREVIALILNLGNEGNKEKLLKGFGFKEEDVQARLDEMKDQGIITDKDLDLVEHMWKTINKLWPEIRALAQRNTGLAPDEVVPSPFTIGGRTLEGGYYPVVYNRRLSHKAEEIAQRKTGDLFENNFLLPAVEKGFTQTRTKFFAPVSLSLDVVPNHIEEVIHYLTHYEAVRAVDKITSSKVVREAITEGLGRETYGLFRPWLQAIAADGVVHESTKWYDAVFRHLRLGSSIAILGFKVTTGLKQIFGLSTSAKELGHHTIIGGGIFLKKLFTGENPFREVAELSPEFANIDVSMDRDIGAMFHRLTTGAFSEYGVLKEKLAHFALAWMMLNQKAVNAITWYGAREKALKEGHPNPVAYADSMVSMTQSAGGVKDLAAIQRGSETEKMFTVMYTYFSVMHNQLTEAMPGRKLPAKIAIMAARWWWLVTLPTLLDAAASTGVPDDDKDREKYLEALKLGQFIYASRSVPVAGDALTAFLQEREVRYGAWWATLLRGAKAAGDVTRGHGTKGDVRSLNDLLGATAGLPVNAARNAMSYMDKLTDGTMEEPVQNLLFRNPSEWE